MGSRASTRRNEFALRYKVPKDKVLSRIERSRGLGRPAEPRLFPITDDDPLGRESIRSVTW